jgi:hypothetical protein
MGSRSWLLFGVALIAGTACQTAGSIDESTGQLVCAGGSCVSDVYVVAHEDDDLLFMSPDLLRSIRAGNEVTTIYLTAGDAGAGVTRMNLRETGVFRAYESMAGVTGAPTWTTTTVTVSSGRTVDVRRLPGTEVRVVFLRLPDGQSGAVTGLSELFANSVTSLTVIGGTTTYTRSQIIDTLGALFVDRSANRISTLDSTDTWATHAVTSTYFSPPPASDNPDHIASARFAFEAQQTYALTHDLAIYRAYNTLDTPEDVGAADFAGKQAAMLAYEQTDPLYCPSPPCSAVAAFPAAYLRRQAGTSNVHGVIGGSLVGRIGGASERCLKANGSVAGSTVSLADCTTLTSLDWTLDSHSRLQSVPGLCLDAATTPPSLAVCSTAETQRWAVFGNGQIRGEGGQCLGLQSDATTVGTLLVREPCREVVTQRWSIQLHQPALLTSGTFGDADLGTTDASQWGSVRFGDVNGDGLNDACARRSTGVWCALRASATGSFNSPTQWSTSFASGFGTADTGGTLMLGPLDTGNSRADICMRTATGIQCALSNTTGTAFGSPFVATTAFGAGWQTSASYYGSLRLADVTGDGRLDLCGRGSAGIVCAPGTGGGDFGALITMITSEFSDSVWYPAAYGTTIQFGDIDGDGIADVCGRGPAGIVCAVSTGSAFVDPHLWSWDFSDAQGWNAAASYYRSVRLGDVNGDGRADVCGRGANGMICASSTGGTMFDVAFPWMPRDFGDAEGWGPEAYGDTVQLVFLDADAQIDVCGRGSNGLICARSRP